MRARARAAPSPSTVAMTAAAKAISRLVRIEGMYVGLWMPAENQPGVNPFQTATLPTWSGVRLATLVTWMFSTAAAEGLLKANTAITTIGR